MQPLLSLLLFGTLASSQVINCKSFGISDGYQGFSKWRASTKDCAEATNKLEEKFGETVPEASNGCVSLAESGNCVVSMCDSTNVRREIPYEAAWLAARVVHGRHKADGNVAGYISLDDYGGGEHFKVFVKVARKDTPDPSNKRRRALFGRRSALDHDLQGPPALGSSSEDDGTAVDAAELETRAPGDRWRRRGNVNIPNTGLQANIQVAWGAPETMDSLLLDNAAEYLLTDWDATQGETGSIPPRAYQVDPGTAATFEWVAHNNHNVQAVTREERGTMVRWAIAMRNTPENGESHQQENFGVQVRRAGQTLGFLIIRVFYIGLQEGLADICG